MSLITYLKTFPSPALLWQMNAILDWILMCSYIFFTHINQLQLQPFALGICLISIKQRDERGHFLAGIEPENVKEALLRH